MFKRTTDVLVNECEAGATHISGVLCAARNYLDLHFHRKVIHVALLDFRLPSVYLLPVKHS